MNKIIGFLLLLLSINLNALEQQSKITYANFVEEMQNLDADSLLQWFLKVDYTRNSLKCVLQDNVPKNLSDKEKETANTIIDNLLSKNNIEEIKTYYINQIKINSLDKQIKTDDEYLKDLIGDILNKILKYLQNSTLVLYEAILEKEENLELAIEYFKLESENNTFLNTQKSTMINKLKKANSFSAVRNDNSQKSLAVLQEEMTLLGLNPIKKAALLAFYFNSIVHRVVQGYGPEFSPAISHNTHLLTNIKERSEFFNNLQYGLDPIKLVNDTCNLFGGKREPNKIIPAYYNFTMEKDSCNKLENILLGNKILKQLPSQVTFALEEGIRKNNIAQEIKINEKEKLTNIKLQSLDNKNVLIAADYFNDDKIEQVRIYRHLDLFGNKFEKPNYWFASQVNLFCSNFVNPLDESIYPTTKSDFNPDINLFFTYDKEEKLVRKPGKYIKLLQHIKNYDYFIHEYPNRVKAYIGSKDVVPRSIVLDDSDVSTMLWYVAKEDKYFVANTNFYNNQDKNYQCQNNKNKQALIALMGYHNELSLNVLQSFAQNDENLQKLCFKDGKFDRGFLLSNLKAIFLNLAAFNYDMLSIDESDNSKSYYCLRPQQLYMDYLIEYDPKSL